MAADPMLVWTDGEAYQDWLNDLMAHAGDEWDDDVAMEAIVTRYVHHLVDENERLREALRTIASDPMKAVDPAAARFAEAHLSDNGEATNG